MSWSFFKNAIISTFLLNGVYGAPLYRRTVTPLSADDVAAFTPVIQFARVGYCADDGAQNLKDWTCGPACDANPNFQPAVAGGDGGSVQFFVTGFDPDENRIVLSYQGTDLGEIQAILTDADTLLDSVNATLFPGLPDGTKVHSGFQDAFARSSDQIFPAIQTLLDEKGTKDVLITGHSLGGALSQLAAMHMALTFQGVDIDMTTFGMPRVGNSQWATTFTEKVPNHTRVNNQKDIVPVIPPQAFSFSHPAGEVHLLDDAGKAVKCDGVESEEADCTDDTLSNVLLANPFNHLGPYVGLQFGGRSCDK